MAVAATRDGFQQPSASITRIEWEFYVFLRVVPTSRGFAPNKAKLDACVKSPRVGSRPAFLGQCQGSVRLIPTFGGRVKQTQFAGAGASDKCL